MTFMTEGTRTSRRKAVRRLTLNDVPRSALEKPTLKDSPRVALRMGLLWTMFDGPHTVPSSQLKASQSEVGGLRTRWKTMDGTVRQSRLTTTARSGSRG